MRASVTYIGHATLAVDLDGTRILTDPVLRDRVAHLYRYAPAPAPESFAEPDTVLLSHLHLDHLDLPSLRGLGRDRRLIVPAGAGPFLRRHGFTRLDEVKPGDTVTVGPLRVTATDANHSGFRPPLGPTCVPIGFVIAGSYSVYFSGDTDIFADMATLAGQIDVALIPIWGWGRVLGPGHLDPARAAEALTLLQPTLAIPIHWGTFATRGALRRDPSFLVEPPLRFAEDATRVAPEVEVTILQPGDSADLVIPAPRRRRVRP